MSKVWLVGLGTIALDYAKVLKALNIDYVAIGRGSLNAKKFEEETGHPAIIGGVEAYIATNPEKPSHVIIDVNLEALSEVTGSILNFGVRNILLEKPGVYHPNEINKLIILENKNKANIYIAYNRRFYASTLKAEEIITRDGGVSSFLFEFTEWGHLMKELYKKSHSKTNYLFLTNSTHVVDLAFFLGGNPKKLVTFSKGEVNWHLSNTVFSGAGITEKDALFSYHANWEAPGRWSVEILTPKHRLYFKPMETLQIQEIGSVAVNPVQIDDTLDKEFKPGLYLQVKSFLEGKTERFCSLQEQKEMIEKVYLKICRY
jgi:dehydrogenase|nr:hypothetical protein [uncultured Capnocytophaga sp.]